MRKGDSVVVIAGPYRGLGGRVRKRAKDGRFIVNLNARCGISTAACLRPGEIRRVQATPNATKQAKT